ncbi:hypothetical protein [Peribacillus sp. SCS-155]|uniref:hypothetical protein n=1 Tax=Peribacillus sedimenti TaxID=3115297 RepID=UPI0039062DB6
MYKKNETYVTTAPEEKKLTVVTDHTFPNLRFMPGDSVDQYNEQKSANRIMAEDEIGQQNENL